MNVMGTLKNAGKAIIFTCKKYAPEILLGVGIAAGVGTVVTAIKSTTKLNEIIEDHEERKEILMDACETGIISCEDGDFEYDGSTYKRDLTVTYLRTGWNLTKLYAPSIGLGTLSVVSILYSYGIMNKRNVAITAAYNAVDGAFRKYRKCVIDELGEEKDKQFRAGIANKKIEEVDAKGKKKTTEVAELTDPSLYSDYARFFDETNPLWKKDPEYNLMFLKAQQDNATRLLRANKYLFLNEVYDMLGIPRTQAGQMVGWLLTDPNNEGFVDFGIYDAMNEHRRDFVNGYEPAILLDFNVDGIIWNRI